MDEMGAAAAARSVKHWENILHSNATQSRPLMTTREHVPCSLFPTTACIGLRDGVHSTMARTPQGSARKRVMLRNPCAAAAATPPALLHAPSGQCLFIRRASSLMRLDHCPPHVPASNASNHHPSSRRDVQSSSSQRAACHSPTPGSMPVLSLRLPKIGGFTWFRHVFLNLQNTMYPAVFSSRRRCNAGALP